MKKRQHGWHTCGARCLSKIKLFPVDDEQDQLHCMN
jgi:hypothetical protein